MFIKMVHMLEIRVQIVQIRVLMTMPVVTVLYVAVSRDMSGMGLNAVSFYSFFS